MADSDFPLVGFGCYLRNRRFSEHTVNAYASRVRGALRAVSPLTEEGLRQYALDVAQKPWGLAFRSAWRAFESYAQAAKVSIPTLPRGRWASRAARDAPAWSWALRELVTSFRVPLAAVPELTWNDVTFGIEKGTVRWKEIGYPVSMRALRALREAAAGGQVPDLYSPLVPNVPGGTDPMSHWRLSKIVAKAAPRAM